MSPDLDAELEALPPPPPRRVRAPQPPLLQDMMRALLLVGALSCLAATLLFVLAGRHGPLDDAFAAAFGLVGVAGISVSRMPSRWLPAALLAMSGAMIVITGATAPLLGWGLSAPGLPLLGLIVCVSAAAGGWVLGLPLTALALGMLGWAGAAQDGASVATVASATQVLGTHLIGVLGGLTAGLLLSRVLARYMRAAEDRERRFASVLGVAADGYWELDSDYRLTEVDPSYLERGLTLALPNGRVGQHPWDLPEFGCDPEVLDQLRADLETRTPFRDLPVTWEGRSGRRTLLISGEPRFDERGAFVGFWGVARDISAARAVQAALDATHERYQELFARIPSPLVVHRGGRVIDANPAALRLFGVQSLGALVGADLLSFYESGDSRERARQRIEALQSEPLGSALPVSDFRMQVKGRAVAVRATGVRVEAEGGDAVLTIYVDDTERLAAEEAVRRSEAMLSHLVATSPDLITLTEMASGRYAMVNHAFERLTGWRAAEAVGRTAMDLGIWASPDDRQRFVAELRAAGSVSDRATRFRTRDGSVVSLQVSAARFVLDRREYMVINARDTSERERERMEREAILANASIGIAMTRDRRFVLANRHFEQLYGWEPGTIIGQPGSVVWPGDEAYAEVGRIAGPPLSQGELVEFESLAQRRDGSSFLARLRGRAVDPLNPSTAGTVWIVEDVTERRAAEQALARARDEAEAASRAKSAFLANTSHELRTPLNGMLGLTEMARTPGLAPARRDQYLDQIAESAQSLAGIISDILDLSKIEAGKLQLEAAAFDLAGLVERLRRTYVTLAQAADLELVVELERDGLGVVEGDELRVRQIVTNYLSNALKFTPQGRVSLRVRRLGPGPLVRFEVADSGPGIDASTRERLFRPFTQADQSTTRRYGGTGLGLSICRELAQLMGGRVGVDSEPGRGSVFWAELPLPLTQRVPETAGAGAEHSLRGACVLMVEDNPVNMMIAAALLERWGVEVLTAADGAEALQVIADAHQAGRRIDAVLMDVQMPVMSGHEATRQLRAQEASEGRPALPVVALTAAALVSEREEAMRAGMNDFLTKPIDADRLHAALVRWCRRGAAP